LERATTWSTCQRPSVRQGGSSVRDQKQECSDAGDVGGEEVDAMSVEVASGAVVVLLPPKI